MENVNEAIEATTSSLSSLEETAASLLMKLQEAMTAGTEYGLELAGRFISYSLAIESVLLVLAIASISIFIFFFIYATKKWKEYRGDNPEGYFFLAFFSCLAAFGCGWFVFYQIKMIIQLLFVPELYIVNFFI